MGFSRVARHRSRTFSLYRQGDINFIVNAEPKQSCPTILRATMGRAPVPWHSRHGRGLCLAQAVEAGAKEARARFGSDELNIPAIEGSAEA